MYMQIQGVSEEYERYAVPGEYLTNQQFSNMHREAEKYLGYPYVWGRILTRYKFWTVPVL